MLKTKTVNIEYCKLRINNIVKPKEKDFMLDEFIESIKDQKPVVMNWTNNEKVILRNFYYDKSKIWVLRFEKLRKYSIPKKTTLNGSSSELGLKTDESLCEEQVVICDPELALCAIHRSQYGLRANGIASFISNFYKKKEEGETIELIPIYNTDLIEELKTWEVFKSLKLKYLNLKENKIDSIIGEVSGEQRLNSKYKTVEFSSGRGKRDALNREDTIFIIESLMENLNEIEIAEVKGNANYHEKQETVNLLKAKIMDSVTIPEEELKSLNCDLLTEEMILSYKNKAAYLERFI